MICPTCCAQPAPIPCPDCGGSGVGHCCGGDRYDWQADAIGCWRLAIQVIGERVRKGEPIPEFLLSEKRR